MKKRGRPSKPLSERTIPIAVKIKHVDSASSNGLTINEYIELRERAIKHLEGNIQALQKEIQRLNKELDDLKVFLIIIIKGGLKHV